MHIYRLCKRLLCARNVNGDRLLYRIVFYCPDRHIEYDGDTPYKVGVGGGVTARVRMARALRKLGHEVTVIANCRKRGVFDGVVYLPLGECCYIECEVLVINTSGGAMDLGSLTAVGVETQLSILWVQGTQVPKSLEQTHFDYLYAPSNFLADYIHNHWGLPLEQIFVTYNPFDEDLYQAADNDHSVRDSYRLVYFSHPDKGLSVSIDVLSKLRAIDPRFHLAVFGGHQLWGQTEIHPGDIEGLFYYGLIGQTQLAHELEKSNFSLCLQTREEPFGMVLTESMRAGCVVVASVVGAFQELVHSGENGFLIDGDPSSEVVHEKAVSIICTLIDSQQLLEKVRTNARSVLWDSDRMAQVWTGHWDWLLSSSKTIDSYEAISYAECKRCAGKCISLQDGLHCIACGHYNAVVDKRD